MQTNITNLLASAQKSLQVADDLSDINSSNRKTIEQIISACARLIQAVEAQQAEIDRLKATEREVA